MLLLRQEKRKLLRRGVWTSKAQGSRGAGQERPRMSASELRPVTKATHRTTPHLPVLTARPAPSRRPPPAPLGALVAPEGPAPRRVGHTGGQGTPDPEGGRRGASRPACDLRVMGTRKRRSRQRARSASGRLARLGSEPRARGCLRRRLPTRGAPGWRAGGPSACRGLANAPEGLWGPRGSPPSVSLGGGGWGKASGTWASRALLQEAEGETRGVAIVA